MLEKHVSIEMDAVELQSKVRHDLKDHEGHKGCKRPSLKSAERICQHRIEFCRAQIWARHYLKGLKGQVYETKIKQVQLLFISKTLISKH